MKLVLSMVLFLIALSNGIQAQTYTLSTATAAYQDLMTDSVLSDTLWVGKKYRLVLPFPIRISNVSTTQIFVDTDARIQRLTTTGGFSSYRTMFWAFGNCGLRQKEGDISKISYALEGETPNRIAKIQFKNAGFVGDESHIDKLNFQIWMHEDGKRVEVVFGPVQGSPMLALNGAYGPFIGIGNQFLRGTPQAPLLGSQDYGLNGMPQEGMVYRFTRP